MVKRDEIDWLIQTTADHPGLAHGIAPRGLLSVREMAVYRTFTHVKRRQDWLLGRWTAKRLAQTLLGNNARACLPDALSILAAADGAPELWLTGIDGQPSQAQLSISHAQGAAFCAMTRAPGVALGADIERIAPRHPAFAQQYFTSAEQAQLAQAPVTQRECLVTAIWSAKEAALKALRCGLRLDTRQITCDIHPPGKLPRSWAAFRIRHLTPDGAVQGTLQGWWRVWQGFVLTLALMGHEQTAMVPAPTAAALDGAFLTTQARLRPLEDRSWPGK